MSPRCLLVPAAAVLALGFGCQGTSSTGSAQPKPTPAIELRDANGRLGSRVTVGHPCRAMVDDLELLIGTEPLVAQVGEARWTGESGDNGTTIKRNEQVVARVAALEPRGLGVFLPDGVAVFRATLVDDKVNVVSGAGALVATAMKDSQGGIAIGDRTLTGSDDLLLAALLAADQAPPEVRGIAACHRLNSQAPAKAP